MILLEGGVGGHMSHLYDNPRLTFATIKKIMQAAADGELEGTEKTDGQNLFISFSVPEQKAKGARNKSNIKAGGLDVKGLAAKFKGKGQLEKTFSESLAAFEDVVKSMSKDQQVEIFGPDTNIYYSAEIIDPRSQNVISYDTKTLAIHRNGAEFDKETGEPVTVDIEDPNYPGSIIQTPKDVSKNAELLDKLLSAKQDQIKEKNYGVQMDAIKNLQALEDKTALNTALSELEKEISSEGISDNQTIINYVMAKLSNYFVEEGLNLPVELEKKVLQKILLSNESYRYAYGYPKKLDKEWNLGTMAKGLPPDQKAKLKDVLSNSKEILNMAIRPIEEIIHNFSVEMIRGLESVFILDNQQELDRQINDLRRAIDAIEKTEHPVALAFLDKQMEKLKKVENISSAAEGFVFDYDGHTYKFTGNFAPMNQLMGLFKYGRKDIPAMEKLEEEQSSDTKREIVLYPGRFQPMGKHHAEVFKALQEKHGSGNVYIITSNKVQPPKSPLNFEEKKKIILKHGIPESQIIQATSPYRIGELADKFDSKGDVVIYAVGKKDMEESPRFSNLDGIKKDGSPTYLKSYDKNINDLMPFENHAYIMVAPHVSIKLPSGEEMSGSTLRDAMRNLTPESFEEVMGWFDKNIYDMLKKKTSNVSTSLSETIFELVEEVLNEKIKKVGSKYIVYPKKGGKRLGTHDTEKAAEKQLAAIEISKQKNEIRTGASVYYGSSDLNKQFGAPRKIEEPKMKVSVKKQKKTTPEMDREEHQMDFEFEEFEDLGEMSAMGGGAAQGSSGKAFKKDEEKTLIREGIPGIKIKTTLRVSAN